MRTGLSRARVLERRRVASLVDRRVMKERPWKWYPIRMKSIYFTGLALLVSISCVTSDGKVEFKHNENNNKV